MFKNLTIPLAKEFKYGLFWNLLNSASTQGLLIAHHFLLRSFIGIEFHAMFGCISSSFYFLLAISNFGLNSSLTPHLQEYTKSKSKLNNFILKQLLPQMAIIIVLAIIFLLAYQYIPIGKSYLGLLTKPLAAVICLTFVLESLKKIIKTFLQLNFFTKEAAIIEVVGMYGYMATIWTSYLCGIKVDLTYCWTLLLTLSAIQTTLYLTHFYEYYNSRPEHTNHKDSNSKNNKIAKTRLYTWSNQVCTNLFSTNFLVPISAFYFGPNQASSLKIIGTISQWIVLIVQNSFGTSSNALLANTKEDSNPEENKEIFNLLSFAFNQIFAVLIIFIAINITKIVDGQSGLSFMILLTLSDSLSSLYQNWFIVKEKANFIFAFNFISSLGLGGLYYFNFFQSNLFLFFAYLLAIRIILFLILSTYSYYKWKLTPNFSIDKKTIITAITLSILFYLIK